ncbi:MAG TPA: glycoside hydrolase family 2 TIM barrel-domain containing protein [Chthoniobacteraceae bacterium]|jgi:beta-galactosidase|nr:glycoside hydrolase family 2 TIM barrel-domain containing protein [Chthoniobacteraceae bacterium]
MIAAPRSFLPILALLISCAASPAATHTEFSAPFAPSEDYVKPAEKPYRQDLCLNGLWQFQPVALPGQFREGHDAPPALPVPNETAWDGTPIRIPSPWNVNAFADKDGQGGDFRTYPSYPASWEKVKMGWLRKTFTVPANWQGKRIQLHFAAVAGDAQILLNGKAVGEHFGIFLPFDVDVTGAVKLGGRNELLVGVRKPSLFDKQGDVGRRPYQAGSFWGQSIAGIWQDVDLVALPQVRVADVYIQPQLDAGRLVETATMANDSDAPATVTVQAGAHAWISKSGGNILAAPLPSSDLESATALQLPPQSVTIPAHSQAGVTLSAPVNGQLKTWSPDSPNLYGLVTSLTAGNQIIDSKYNRFGWRQVGLRGSQFILNGKPFVMHGDSWHFMGIPQMTRRYPWAWFTALKSAHLNAVRLHAEPYPAFYLDVADEMGILVLDETAVWASDGGPRLNDPAFWTDTEHHLAGLVSRDRDHPSVFGWSASNEVRPIVNMSKSATALQALLAHYTIWRNICNRLDPSRAWVSCDGEGDGEGRLPVYMMHYGGEGTMQEVVRKGEPWGMGEAGEAYYATPAQVAKTNGDRAYESFEGRMEGVAASSYANLMLQRKYDAVYRSVFNLVWYGLKPLPLGLADTSKAPTLDDGIYFTSFHEGQPGVQPERLGPYCTTLNPGYSAALPLFQTWPLYEAIRDAAAEPPVPCPYPKPVPPRPQLPPLPRVTSLHILAGPRSVLADQLIQVGVPVSKLETASVPQLLIIDGTNPPPASIARPLMEKVYAARGAVFVWGAAPGTLNALNALLPAPLEVTERSASSLLPGEPDAVTAGLTAAKLYFSELRPPIITTEGLAGPLASQSAVLLKDCDTDWLKWNGQPEWAKTAMILRSEREAKPAGAVLIAGNVNGGKLYVTTLPAAPRLSKEEDAVRTILANLGLTLGTGTDTGAPLLKTGSIVRVLRCASFPVASIEAGAQANIVDPSKGDAIRTNATVDGHPWQLEYSESGLFDFHKMKFSGPRDNAIAYLSFWVMSPRQIDNLLLEPNAPVVGMDVAADDAVQVWVNGEQVINKIRSGPIDGGEAKVNSLKLQRGWNHFLIKVIQGGGAWAFKGQLTCNQPEFLTELVSALEKP